MCIPALPQSYSQETDDPVSQGSQYSQWLQIWCQETQASVLTYEHM